jgi:hypothetical protein
LLYCCNSDQHLRTSLIPNTVVLSCIHYAHTAASREILANHSVSPACIFVNFISLTSSVKFTIGLWTFIKEKVTSIFTDTIICKEKKNWR